MGEVRAVMLSIVCFKWKAHKGARSRFTASHVNRLREMLEQRCSVPHRFFCVTDDPAGIDSRVHVVPLWPDHAEVMNPHGAREPSCYRRMKLFSRDVLPIFGERVLSIDLDMMLTADIAPLVNRTEDVVLLHTDNPQIPVNGSLVLLTPGAAQHVWDSFDPATSPILARRANCFGSDQGWIAYCLPDAARWHPERDGILFFWKFLQQHGARARLPDGTRLVSFHARGNPWDDGPQSVAWVREHYGEVSRESRAA